MQIKNPHQPGTLCFTNFNTHAAWYGPQTQAELVAKHAELSQEAKNFNRYSVQQMMGMDFEVKCISEVHEARFGVAL